VKVSRVQEFARHTAASYPGDHGQLYAGCGPEPSRVAATVQNLLLHPVVANRRGVPIPDQAKDDAQSRTVRRLLSRLLARDGRALSRQRDAATRFFGTSRDCALLACSLFREHGVPARLRVGFATYVAQDFLEDHWICEYRRDGAWRLLDAQIGAQLALEKRIDFDPADVPADRFLRSGEAWRRVTSGAIRGHRIGVSSIGGVRGAWFAAASVCRDVAVLAGREELLPWDYWGKAAEFCSIKEIPEPWPARIDALAALTASADIDLDLLLPAYADRDWLYLEDRVTSYARGAPETVNLRGLG
jgi:hypothetical protein